LQIKNARGNVDRGGIPLSNETLTERFSSYFDREVAQEAAKSLGNGAEIEFRIPTSGETPEETFTFTKKAGKNAVVPGPASNPQLVFVIPSASAQEILDFESDEIGPIGVQIAKLVVSPDANRRVSIQFKAGFFTLFSKGYLGVVTAGGAQFASFLASRGLNGIAAIKSLLGKK
jgi:hypothetical protein